MVTSDSKEGDNERDLVHRFVKEAMVVANVKLQGWIRKYAVYFEDDGQNESKGESLEQYQVYKQWVSQLENELKSFWVQEGFESAEDCFIAIEKAVNRDKERQKEAIASVLSQLQTSAAFMGQIASSGQEVQQATEAVAAAAAPLLCLLLLPVSQEELVDMVLRLADYPIFSRMMRAYAHQLKADRIGRNKLRGFLNKAQPKSPQKNEALTFKTDTIEVKKTLDSTTNDDDTPQPKAKEQRSGRIEVKAGASTKALQLHNEEEDDDDDDDDLCSPRTLCENTRHEAEAKSATTNKVSVKRGWG